MNRNFASITTFICTTACGYILTSVEAQSEKHAMQDTIKRSCPPMTLSPCMRSRILPLSFYKCFRTTNCWKAVFAPQDIRVTWPEKKRHVWRHQQSSHVADDRGSGRSDAGKTARTVKLQGVGYWPLQWHGRNADTGKIRILMPRQTVHYRSFIFYGTGMTSYVTFLLMSHDPELLKRKYTLPKLIPW